MKKNLKKKEKNKKKKKKKKRKSLIWELVTCRFLQTILFVLFTSGCFCAMSSGCDVTAPEAQKLQATQQNKIHKKTEKHG